MRVRASPVSWNKSSWETVTIFFLKSFLKMPSLIYFDRNKAMIYNAASASLWIPLNRHNKRQTVIAFESLRGSRFLLSVAIVTYVSGMSAESTLDSAIFGKARLQELRMILTVEFLQTQLKVLNSLLLDSILPKKELSYDISLITRVVGTSSWHP